MHDGDTTWNKLLDQIDRQGWGWQIVEPDRGDDEHEPFPHYCYTVGLVGKGLPDMIVVGLDVRTAMAAGNEIITRAMANAIVGQAVPTVGGFKPFDLNQELLDVFKGTRAMLVDVSPAQAAKRSLFAHDYAAAMDTAPDLIQLVWPDRNGRLPFEDGADPRIIEVQPVLKYIAHADPTPTDSPVM